MEKSQNFGHEHPLLVLNEEHVSNVSEKAECWKCGEKVSAPSFCCVEYCGFYLHKICAEAPLELIHPFHGDHPLVLMQNAPYSLEGYNCDFCYKDGEKFVYRCSCELDFHIKCALFTYTIAEKNLKKLEHVAFEDPLTSIQNDDKKLEDPFTSLIKCLGCWEPLVRYTYFSLDCGFTFHKKCAELPLKINHMCHRKHPLVLQFNNKRLSCKICQVTKRRGFVYGCLPCEFVIHVGCVSPTAVVEDKTHQHSFIMFWRQIPFICDACGIEGNHAACRCGTCSIIVHKQCISLPRVIKSRWHHHRVFHRYFFHKEYYRSLDCIICHEEVNIEHGSYYCEDCNIIFHVNCVTKEKDWYHVVSLENEDEESLDLSINSITNVLVKNNAGEATLIEHFKHKHYLMLCDKISEYDDKYCDGCLLPVSTSFYYCSYSQCDFFLHKACAELPKKKNFWHHICRSTNLILTSDYLFRCEICGYLSNAFAYICEECEKHVCLRCVIALTPGARTSAGHEHPLLFYINYKGKCSACGIYIAGAFLCKDCNFALDCVCFSLPTTARHKCDEHLLKLTYHEDNDYSEYHYCDICEKRRDSKHWFYYCAICDNSAHVNCVLGKYPFIKLGSSYKERDHPKYSLPTICGSYKEKDHRHRLTFVKKIYHYPKCIECDDPCQDLALECAQPGCNYLVDWECIRPYRLRRQFHRWRRLGGQYT